MCLYTDVCLYAAICLFADVCLYAAVCLYTVVCLYTAVCLYAFTFTWACMFKCSYVASKLSGVDATLIIFVFVLRIYAARIRTEHIGWNGKQTR